MQIAQKLSGFTAGEADILRRAMGKKKRAELEKQKQRFVDGAFKNGISKDIAAGIFLMSNFLSFFFISFCVLLITVRVLSPKKSNLIRPAFSAEYISNCVEGNKKSADVSLYKGTDSVNFLSAITTPAAWVAIFLFKPSSFNERSINFLTRGASFINF